jgi:hypothetical protein
MKQRDKRLDWFIEASVEDVVMAFVEDGSLVGDIQRAVVEREDEWIRIATQNAKDAQARAIVAAAPAEGG